MKIFYRIKNIIFFLIVSCFLINCGSNKLSEELYSVKNGRIIAPNGNEVSIKGCNIGNWFVLEMWMLDQKLPDQYTFELILEERFGKDTKNELMKIYRENWITEKDFETIKSFGMNTIRIPFQYTILMDPENPYKLKENAFYWLDKTIEWAENNDLSVILDLHGCPGRQSGMDHTGRSGYNRLWEEEEYQNQTVWLWKEISKYYMKDNRIVAYDLLNEPWGGTEEQLRDIMFRMFKEIRAQGDNHIIIFPGHYSGIDFYIDGIEPYFENFIYTKHFYPGFFGWGAPVPQVHADFLNNGLKKIKEQLDSLNNTLLVGEFNVVSKKALMNRLGNTNFVEYVQFRNKNSGIELPLIEITTTLEKDINTKSGFDWGGGKGPDLEITKGTITRINVVAEERKPIEYIIPILRNLTGIY